MMHAWDCVQASVNWIEENISEKIEIEALAKISHLSQFYFQRLFNRLIGKPVMEYVKLRRLAKAADYLAVNNVRILDVALLFGFETHETFTRAFKAVYGLTPEDFRANPRPLSHFLMPDISMNYCLIEENVPLVADGIILEIFRRQIDTPYLFSGYRIQNPMSDTPGVDFLSELWDHFHQKKVNIPYLVPQGLEAGVSSPGETEECFTYFAGAQVDHFNDSEIYSNWSTPLGEYIICSFEAENFYLLTTNALNKARDYLFGVWLPGHKLITEPFMAEFYYDTSPTASRMEIWLKLI